MTKLEIKSKRKAKSLKFMVEIGEYSIGYALKTAEDYNDNGLILDVDYEPLAEYLENLMNEEEQEKILQEENNIE